MFKKISSVLLVFFCILMFNACNYPDERYILSGHSSQLPGEFIESVIFDLASGETITIDDPDEFSDLAELCRNKKISKAYEGNNKPAVTILCSVKFKLIDAERINNFFTISVSGQIYFMQGRIGDVMICYMGESEEILNEVNRLIALKVNLFYPVLK